MFPGVWAIPYINVAAPNNVNLSEVDVVGDTSNPALFYQIIDNDLAFRMRLNSEPRFHIKGVPLNDLTSFVWGIQMKSTNGIPLFTIGANGSYIGEQGQQNAIELRRGALDGELIYLDLDPWLQNLEVVSAGAIFPSTAGGNPDDDLFLDFKLPISAFVNSDETLFNFDNEAYIFCYFTSTNFNNIDKEGGSTPPTTIAAGDVCGNVINPPILSLVKRCQQPQASGFFNVGDTMTILLQVTNSGDSNAANVTVLDKINIPVNVTISSIITTPTATVNPLLLSYSNTDILITWTGLTIPHNNIVPLTVSFTLLSAPVGGAVITNVDAGIGQLSGTTEYRCFMPVKLEGGRGVELFNL